MKTLTLLIFVFVLSGCATISRPRVQWGMAIGSAAGGIGGAVLSPNDASRGTNAAVFGAIGMVAGGLLGYLTEPKAPGPPEVPTLKARELAPNPAAKDVQVSPPDGLPSFVKARLQEVVIEEFEEPDTVAADGALHEPHKVYRIKKPAELFAKPIASPTGGPQQ